MKFIKKSFLKLFLIIFEILISLRLNFFAAFMIFLSLRKLYFTKKNNKNLIILEKSHGIEDFRVAYNKRDHNLNIYVLQRKLFNIIFKKVFKNRAPELRDNYYVINDYQLKNRQDELLSLLNSILANLSRFINISAFVSFNFKYYAERELHKACKKNNIKFIACHKECNVFDGELDYYKKILINIDKFQGDLITVYNERYKNLLIEAKVFDKEKIIVTGMPRADIFFNKIDNKEEHILIFLISTKRSLKYIYESKLDNKISDKEKSLNWDKLAFETIHSILQVAKNYPNLKFTFKTKVKKDLQTAEQQKLINKFNLDNCKIVYGGNSINQIKNSKFVIGFNTTGIIESLIAGKKVLTPYFDIEKDEFKKKFILDDYNLALKAKNTDEFKNLLKDLIEDKKELNIIDEKILKNLSIEHIGNADGLSGEKLREAISKIII